jgi:hypothetical protein
MFHESLKDCGVVWRMDKISLYLRKNSITPAILHEIKEKNLNQAKNPPD